MNMRIVALLDGIQDAVPALARAEQASRVGSLPIHLICFIDIDPLIHFGANGPAVDISRYRERVPRARNEAERYLKLVAQKLNARGIRVTYEIRTGSLRFEMPAAIRPGDLVVTNIQTTGSVPPRRLSGRPQWEVRRDTSGRPSVAR